MFDRQPMFEATTNQEPTLNETALVLLLEAAEPLPAKGGLPGAGTGGNGEGTPTPLFDTSRTAHRTEAASRIWSPAGLPPTPAPTPSRAAPATVTSLGAGDDGHWTVERSRPFRIDTGAGDVHRTDGR